MGGKILEYEAKTILNKGRDDTLKQLIRIKLEKGKSIEKIADELEQDVEKIKELIQTF